MTLQLTAAQTTLWNTDAQWKAGFLLGLSLALEPLSEITAVTILDDGGAQLAAYAKVFTPVP